MNNNSIEQHKKFIDIEQLIKNKNAALHRLMPRFVISYLKKILHEDRINSDIERNLDKYDFDFIDPILDSFGVDVECKNIEKIPAEGRYTIASNHPLGGLDGLALIQVTGKRKKNVKFLVNDLLLNLKNLQNLFLPVNKVGSNTKEAAILIEEAYKSDALILTFPFGLVSRKRKGQIKDLEWRRNFLVKSRIHKRSIIPVYIEGRNSPHFYFISNFRKFLGIKANIEMFFLVDEMYRQNNKTIKITIGNPIDINLFDSSFTDTEWSEKLRQYVYCLKNDPELDFLKYIKNTK